MKLSIAITLPAALSLSGCRAPPTPVADETIVTSEVGGLKLTHRHAIQSPHSFTSITDNYRALYVASVLTSPGFGGEIVRHRENGKRFTLLGIVRDHWLAVAEVDQPKLIGYIPFNAGVKNNFYKDALKDERPHA